MTTHARGPRHGSTQWVLSLFVAALSATSVIGQGPILIGPSTQNGSFETGTLDPWGSAFDVRVVQDPAFASAGSYYAEFRYSLVRPVLAGQNLLPNPNERLEFSLSFDARTGTPGLEKVYPRMGGRTPDGISLEAVVTTIAAPPLTITGWETYQYHLIMPAAWDNQGITLGIAFNIDQPLEGTSYSAYLDNVVLRQVPEPSVCVLGIAGGLLAFGLNWRRR